MHSASGDRRTLIVILRAIARFREAEAEAEKTRHVSFAERHPMLCSAAAPSPRDKRLLKAAPNEGSAKCSLHAGEPQQYIYSSVTDRIIMKPLVMREPDT